VSGVYSNTEILRALDRDHIVIRPFNRFNLAGTSYDVTLGEWYFRTERSSQRGVYNPTDETEVERYFDGPHQAQAHNVWCEANGRTLFKNIPADHPIIVVQPGERILAHTHEFIGIRAPGTSTMAARSTWGRNGVAVCLDAGWGDPGYINRWTMEVYNMNQHDAVVLPAGERVAQMVFYHTGPVEGEYSRLSGKYQEETENDIEIIIAGWSPELMLPRAYKDKRRKPLPL